MRSFVGDCGRISLSVLLALALCPALSFKAFADDADESYDASASQASSDASRIESDAADQDDLAWTTCGTCEWAIDKLGELIVRPINGTEGTLEDFRIHAVPWRGEDFISASFEGKVFAPSTRRMFQDCSSLESIDLSGLDTSSTSDTSCMFDDCSSLTSLDVSNFDTSKVKDMEWMFRGCSSLTSLDVSNFDTSQVRSMSYMFASCSSLTSLDLSNFDTSSLTDASGMLSSCLSLKSLRVNKEFPLRDADVASGHWKSSVDGIIYESVDMPSGVDATYTRIEAGEPGCVFRCGTCEWYIDDAGTLVVRPEGGAALGVLRDWAADSIDHSPWAGLPIASARFEGRVAAPSAIGMFEGCSSLESVDLSGLDISSATDMSSMFERCSALASADLSRLDTSSIASANSIFSECGSLRTLDLSGIDMSSIVDMNSAFYKCLSLESIDLPRLDSQSLRGLTSTFSGCSSLKTLDLSGVNAPRLHDLNWTFADCTSLESIDFGSSHFSRMESMDYTFYNCASLQSLDLSTFDASKVTSMNSTFEDCSSLKTINLSDFDASSAGVLKETFRNCNSLQSLDLSGFAGGLYSNSMFYFDCGESFRLTIGEHFGSYDVTVNSFASFPSIRSGHYLDRIVTGRWKNVETGEVLETRSIPSNVAATYAPEVIYRDLGASVEISAEESCPAYVLRAEVSFGSGVSDPDLDLYYQWFDAGSDQPVSSVDVIPIFYIPESGIGKKYYCIVTDTLEDGGNKIKSNTMVADHVLDEQWVFDETGHWRECSICSDPTEKAAHIFGDWKIVRHPYTDEPGERERSCTTCGYVEREEVLAEPFKNPFIDVVEGTTPHYEDILWLAEREITTGFPDGTFRPYDSIARCDMAAFLYRLAGSPSYEVTDADLSKFTDVDEDTPHFKEVCWLASTGISEGFPDGTFRPYDNIARCDMAAFLYRLSTMMGASGVTMPPLFFDVDSSTPHSEEIGWLNLAGISSGFVESNGALNFRPYADVARCDMAAFLHRLDDYVGRYEVN